MTLIEEYSALNSNEARVIYTNHALSTIHIRLKIPWSIKKEVGASYYDITNKKRASQTRVLVIA